MKPVNLYKMYTRVVTYIYVYKHMLMMTMTANIVLKIIAQKEKKNNLFNGTFTKKEIRSLLISF